jgi:NAD(P)-dependent dehydrogenase (short-subunit alcohol dehydrogenase family)
VIPRAGRPGRLDGRVCLVAGSTGIAAAGAERFAAEGASVFVTSRDETHCRDLADRLRAAGASSGHRAADLEREDAAVAAVADCVAAFGRVDGLFSVAGGSGRRHGDGPLHEVGLDGWEATLRMNLTPQFLVLREVLRAMLEQSPGPAGRGSVVLMSSISGFHPSPAHFGTHAYATAKAAILGLVRATAAYYAPVGIRVNGLAPGLVRTPMSARAQGDADVQADAADRQPLTGAFLEADDVAGAAAYLLADESRAVTGQLIGVDGGWSVSDGSGWRGPEIAR